MDYLPHDVRVRSSVIDTFFKKLYSLKPSDAWLLKGTLIVVALSGSVGLVQLSNAMSVPVPQQGGELIEGVVGIPRFINPVLAVTRVDKDITALVYDGLLSLGQDGALEFNVASSITPSDDGKIYNVIIRPDVYFHDETQLTAHDIAFTVSKINDQVTASPLRANFDGVRVEIINDFELNFILPEPYTPFIENLTFGILPHHLWKDVPAENFAVSQLNTTPIGTGPFRADVMTRTKAGIPNEYTLTAYEQYHRGTPRIETVRFVFFATEKDRMDAFARKYINSMAAIDPQDAQGLEETSTYAIMRIPLPRTFAIFFNQNKSAILRDTAVRQALNTVIDRDALVRDVLSAYGSPLNAPIPPGFGYTPSTTELYDAERFPSRLEAAYAILTKGGWKRNVETNIWEKSIDGTITPLSIELSTAHYAPFDQTATFIERVWTELGVYVAIKQYEQSDLTQGIIRPRDYETLLFGSNLGRGLDFYSFWHSSQRIDPGLNIALYTNIDTDKALTTIRTTRNKEDRVRALDTFVSEIRAEIPAIFLYAPEFIYVLPTYVHGATISGLSEPPERFARIHEWYIETESMWPIFLSEKQ